MLLVIPFVCQIVAGLGFVGYLSYRNGQRGLQEMTIKLRKEIAIRIDNHIEQLIDNGNNLNQVNQDTFLLNPLLIENLTELGSYFARQHQWNPHINLISFTSAKEGNYVEVAKTNAGELELTIVDHQKSNALLRYQIDAEGKIIELLATNPEHDYEPRTQPWYKNIIKNQDNSWHETQKKSASNEFIFLNSQKVYNAQGQFLGIVNNQFNLHDLSSFLGGLRIGKTGDGFIIDKEGRLIADSLMFERNLHRKQNQFLLDKATANPHEYIRDVSRAILTNQPSTYQMTNNRLLSLKVDNKKLLVEVNNFTSTKGIEWLIVLIIPESDFMDFITQNNRVTISLLIVALITAISSGLVTSKLIIRPIIKLQTASQKIAEGEFNQQVPLQGIKELDTLADYFNNMTQMLDSFFTDLNKSFQEVSNLKYAIDQSAIVTVTDPQGNIVYCNEKLSEISGYSSEELIGKKTSALKSNVHEEYFYQQMWAEISAKKVWRGEIKNKTKDGHYYWVDTTIVPLLDEQANIVQYLSIQSEITERKQLEKNLEEIVHIRTKELAKANEEITSLNKRLCTENIQMSGKLRILHEMQQLILPTTQELKQIKCLDIAGYMEPADELGGDYYDVLTGDNTITIGIGDVTGHGLESGILMVMTQAAICTLKQRGENNPLQFLDTLNRTIYYNVKRMNSEKNLSLAIINYFKGNVCISGQHEEVIVVRENGTLELIDTIDLGLPIGIDEDIKEFIDHTIITLDKGDGMVLYTDGITEARDVNKNQYGIERLCNVISQNWHLDSEKIKKIVIDDVKKFIGLQKIEDDLTLLLLKQR